MTNKKDYYEAKTTNKPYLIVDLDDTISELLETWLRKYNEKKGYVGSEAITKEEIKFWDLCKHPKIESDIFDLLHDPSTFFDAEVKRGADMYLSLLKRRYEIYIVSSCNPDAYKPKWDWLTKHFPFLNITNFVACTPKHIIKAVPGSVMVDDKVSNLCEFGGTRILMAREYNHPDNYGEYECEIDFRAETWEEIYDFLVSKDLHMALENNINIFNEDPSNYISVKEIIDDRVILVNDKGEEFIMTDCDIESINNNLDEVRSLIRNRVKR